MIFEPRLPYSLDAEIDWDSSWNDHNTAKSKQTLSPLYVYKFFQFGLPML